jgi:hypothetical protein
MRVEHEYLRRRRLDLLGSVRRPSRQSLRSLRSQNGIATVDRLVSEVMSQAPFSTAHRVFWIMDNCSVHREQKAVDRFRTKWPNAISCAHPDPRLVGSTRSRSTFGSTRSRSTFRLYKERFSLPTTSVLCPNSNTGFWLSRHTTSATPRPSSGPSPAKISTLSWPESPANPSHSQPNQPFAQYASP